jgi:hypothetical protein
VSQQSNDLLLTLVMAGGCIQETGRLFGDCLNEPFSTAKVYPAAEVRLYTGRQAQALHRHWLFFMVPSHFGS